MKVQLRLGALCGITLQLLTVRLLHSSEFMPPYSAPLVFKVASIGESFENW